MATMTLEQFKQGMADGSISGASSHQMRNEDIQTKPRRKSYPFIKRELGKISKLLIPKELAFDFNPMTGKQDDDFNPQRKFRPMMSATSLALLVKEMADKVPETKERLLSKAGIKEWDTSDYKTLTETDYLIFKPWVQIQIFTLTTFNTTLKALSQKAWGVNYLINVKRDPITGSIIGDIPTPLLISYLCSALAQEEIKEYDQKIKNKEIDQTDEQQKEFKSKVYSRRLLVGQDQPLNMIRLYELPLDQNCNLTVQTLGGGVTEEKLNELICVSRLTNEIQTTLDKYRVGPLKVLDDYFDFYELDMSCPTKGDDAKSIGKDTRYEKPLIRLKDISDIGPKVIEEIRNERDNCGDIESLMYSSARVRVYNADVEAKLLDAAAAQIELDDPYMTDKVVLGNKEIIGLLYGDEGYARIEAAEGGFSGAKEGSYDAQTANTEAREAENDLSDLDMSAITEIEY